MGRNVDDDARIRRALHRLDQLVSSEGVLDHIRRKKRRYHLTRRLEAAGLTVAVVAATGAGVYGLTTVFDSDVRPGGTGPSTMEGRTACPGDIPFLPSYLPQGFGREPVEGPAPGAPPAQAGQTVIHFRGEGGSIEIRRPATPVLEAGEEAPALPPLGRETAEAADEGRAVHFRDPVAELGDPCATYSVQAYGVGREELATVAERLDHQGSGSAFEACPEVAGSLPPGSGAEEDAVAAAVMFVRGTHRSDAGQVRAVTDTGVGWPLAPLGAELVDEPVAVVASGSAADQGVCGDQVAARSWWVRVDDGTDSASLDLTLYLIRRSDGWKVWGLY
jgi:hypothetical protein